VTKPLVGVDVALYPEIHQAPSLDTFIHIVFLALAINYANQGYMDGRAILTTKKYNCELFQHSNCRGRARAKIHIFVGKLDGNMGRLGYGD
jgi:hypothetical protein